jgi:hypothetical protein
VTALASLLVLAFTFALGYWAGVSRDRRRPRQPLDLESAELFKEVRRWRPERPQPGWLLQKPK